MPQMEQAVGRLKSRMKIMNNIVQKHRAYLRQASTHTRFKLTQIRRLSDDVLLIILKKATSPSRVLEGRVCRLPPWSISAVCQQWRYVALTSPWLWSSILVGRHRNRRSQLQKDDWIPHTNVIGLPLARSASCSLDLITDLSVCVEFPLDMVEQTFGQIMGVVHRCHKLTIMGLDCSQSWARRSHWEARDLEVSFHPPSISNRFTHSS